MDVKTIILGALFQKSMTGYELKKIFDLSFAYFSGLSYGSIYPALKKMEAEGLISMRLEIQDGAPNRKVYTITDAGKETFLQALRRPIELERVKNAFLMKLFFFTHLSPAERLKATADYLEKIRAVSEALEAIGPEIEAVADRFQYLCFQFGCRFLQDLTGNVEAVMAALRANEDPKLNDQKEET